MVVTEIPEHLLKRSRERRAAIGKGGDDATEASSANPAPSNAVERTAAAAPAAAAPAPAAAPASPLGSGRAMLSGRWAPALRMMLWVSVSFVMAQSSMG